MLTVTPEWAIENAPELMIVAAPLNSTSAALVPDLKRDGSSMVCRKVRAVMTPTPGTSSGAAWSDPFWRAHAGPSIVLPLNPRWRRQREPLSMRSGLRTSRASKPL